MFPAAGTLQDRPQRRSMLRVEGGKLAADQIEAFDLILERRQSVRQTPYFNLQSLDTFRKGFRIGDKERQIEFAGDPEQRLGHAAQCLLARIPFPVDARGVVQPSSRLLKNLVLERFS